MKRPIDKRSLQRDPSAALQTLHPEALRTP
jgi:hypothetical protein